MNSFDLDGAKAWVRSDQFRWVAAFVIAVLALFVAFQAGQAFGFHRAEFGYHLDENYGRTFGAPAGRLMPPGKGFPGGHGATGKIVSIAPASIVLAPNTGPEQQVSFDTDTLIRNQDMTSSTSALIVGASVVVFGEPDNGSIHARLIRIVPAPATTTPSR